jgi:hypothetical protein
VLDQTIVPNALRSERREEVPANLSNRGPCSFLILLERKSLPVWALAREAKMSIEIQDQNGVATMVTFG